jgi:23S rRNA pseudouridine1911/1915/1917 synthase
VVFEDEHLIVVDKPAGVVVHPSAGHPAGTLAQALAGRAAGGDDAWRPGIVHRLDRDTSGLLVVAKSDAVHRALQEEIQQREMRREYIALVDGRPDARSGTIDAPIGRDRGDRTVHSTSTDRPREARTHFEITEEFPRTTLLHVRLETGRTHQIRVHLAAIGHPVCGDVQYGGRESGRRLGLTRQFLHAWKLAFRHPVTGQNLVCESNLPADLLHASDAAKREPASDGPDGSRT